MYVYLQVFINHAMQKEKKKIANSMVWQTIKHRMMSVKFDGNMTIEKYVSVKNVDSNNKIYMAVKMTIEMTIEVTIDTFFP